MENIYDIIREQEKLFDQEYKAIQEGQNEILLIEKTAIVTLEELVYNNPEKKKLSVLMEEAESNEMVKTQSLVEKLKEQMQRVINWIMNMFKHYEKLFQEGANFVKNNDLNACMNKIKAKQMDVNVTWHSQKPPFQRMQTTCLRGINFEKFVTKRMRGNSNAVGDASNEHLASGDKTENYLTSLMKEFKLDKENLAETKITAINVLVIHNDLATLPEANKKLNNIKSKVQRLYNNAINEVREKARSNKEKKAAKADNELAFINSQIKSINEQIRAYAKIMTMVFKEDYNIAKLIVSKATGKEFKDKKEKKGK